MLNLKSLRVKLYGDDPQVIKLKASGGREVSGKDLNRISGRNYEPRSVDCYLTDKKS